MICNNCGKFNPDSAAICSDCGKPLNRSGGGYSAPAYSGQPIKPSYSPRYQRSSAPAVPSEYKPLSPWAYFGYQLLFAIPLVGFILLIVFSCGGTSNINLKNYARSYWCGLIIGLILAAVLVILIIAMGGLSALESSFNY